MHYVKVGAAVDQEVEWSSTKRGVCSSVSGSFCHTVCQIVLGQNTDPQVAPMGQASCMAALPLSLCECVCDCV